MKTTLDMDPAVVDAAKALAERTHRSIGAIVSELARKGLGMLAPNTLEEVGISEPIPTSQRNGFPVFFVPDDAVPITTEDVRKILADEDLPD